METLYSYEILVQELHEAKSKITRYEALIQHFEEMESEHLAQKPELPSCPTPAPVQESQEPCTECEQQKETYETKITLLNEEIKNMRKEIKELQTHLRDKCVEANSYHSQVTSLQTNLNSVKEKLESAQSEQKEEISFLRHALENSNDELQNATERCSSLQEKIREINEQLLELECDKAILSSELAASKANPEMAERGNSLFAEVEAHRKEAVSKFMMLRSRYNDLKIASDNQKITIQDLEGQIRKLKNLSSEDPRIGILKERINTSDSIIEELNQTNKQMKNLMDDMSKKFDHSMCSFATMHNMVNHAENISKRYLHEKNELSMERYDLMMKMNDAKCSLHSFQQEYSKIQAVNRSIENSFDSVLEELKDAQEKLSKGCPVCNEKSARNGCEEETRGVKFSNCTKIEDGKGQKPRPKPKEFPIFGMQMDPVTGKCKVFQVNPKIESKNIENDENKPPDATTG